MAPHNSLPSSARSASRRESSYSYGTGKPGKGKKQHNISRRQITIVVVIVVAALLLAGLVGFVVYQQTVKNALKPNFDTATVSSQLKTVKSSTTPYWTVLAKTDASSAEEGRGSIAQLAFVYVDPDNKSVSMLWVPPDTRVYLDGYGYRTIAEAFDLGQETALVSAMAKLGSVDIAHYVEVNDAGLAKLENQLGVASSDASSSNPGTVLSAVLKIIVGSSSEQITTRSGYVSNCVTTDMDSDALSTAFQALQGMDTDNEIYSADMPYKTETYDGTTYAITSTGSWNTMLTRVSSGMSPVASKKEKASNATMRANNTVTIWNGVGVSGVASDCATELKKHGWSIESTGNAAQFVYDETLVVYKNESDESAAELLVSDLGQGRAVRSAARYSFSGSILVVIGQDYQPY